MKKVLIVDDSMFMRQSLKMIFEKNGYEVVGEAENGEKAVAQYEQLLPDLVTMDVTMPVMDGVEALKCIKKSSPSAKVLMVTAMGQESIVKEAVIQGACGFVVKPIIAEVLINAVKKL
ncbi:response regulator [Anoxynatronum buryatiense]|uniref:Stage 0 sporulation protein A homolog n=1 Tax=Anoxynatronum buryatiense TaxID=489973 RepID=A0AA46AHT8_9CLOT|nr:response regulator [Anoxynatronum buryatiense]SMP43401.1 two-component system, chemotaxis family, response regulator CheY [Anoxynatronum buryatiense]